MKAWGTLIVGAVIWFGYSSYKSNKSLWKDDPIGMKNNLLVGNYGRLAHIRKLDFEEKMKLYGLTYGVLYTSEKKEDKKRLEKYEKTEQRLEHFLSEIIIRFNFKKDDELENLNKLKKLIPFFHSSYCYPYELGLDIFQKLNDNIPLPNSLNERILQATSK